MEKPKPARAHATAPESQSAATPAPPVAEAAPPSVYQLAEQLEQLVRQLLPQDPEGLLLRAAVRRGGWTGD